MSAGDQNYRDQGYRPSEHCLLGPYGPLPNITITLQDFKRFADSHKYMLEFCAEVCGTTPEKFCEFDKMKFRKKLDKAITELNIQDVQWQGMYLAFEKHGQNLNIDFFKDMFIRNSQRCKDALDVEGKSGVSK